MKFFYTIIDRIKKNIKYGSCYDAMEHSNIAAQGVCPSSEAKDKSECANCPYYILN